MATTSIDRFAIAKSDSWEVFVEKGSKSKNDFKVRYNLGKRDRTPKHIHLIIDLLLKRENEPGLTSKLIDHLLEILAKIKPSISYPPKLQIFEPKIVKQFEHLNKFGEYSVDFLLIIFELIMIQEKTNYPNGVMNLALFQSLKNNADIFSLVSTATFR